MKTKKMLFGTFRRGALNPLACLLALLLCFSLISCGKFDEQELGESRLKFAVSSSSPSSKAASESGLRSMKNADAGTIGLRSAMENASSVTVTLENASNGNTIEETIELISFGGGYMTQPISVLAGNYRLNKFVVLDADSSAIYATPREGSGKAHLVQNPLPINFSAVKDQLTTVRPEVITVGDLDGPPDFGYINFEPIVINTFKFLVSVFVDNTMDVANIQVKNGDDQIYQTGLEAKSNIIELPDNGGGYTLIVTKGGYHNHEQTLTADELKAAWSDPLKIYLEVDSSLDSDLKTFGGSLIDGGASITSAHDQGYIIGGNTHSFSDNEKSDAYIVRVNPFGEKVWENHYGGSEYDNIGQIIKTAEGGYALVGSSGSFGSLRGKIYLLKIDVSGNKQWEKSFGENTDQAYGRSLQQTSDGGYIITGNSTETDPWLDFRLTKVDENGTEEWTKFFGRDHDDTPNDIKITPDGGYIMFGMSGYWGNNCQAWIIKTDSQGVEQWNVLWGGAEVEEAHSGIVALDGGYLATGYTESYGTGDSDIFILKITATGDVEWYKTAGGPNLDYGYKIQQRANGNIIVVGSTYNDVGQRDALVVEMDSNGNILNRYDFGGDGDDYALGVIVEDNNYVVTGATNSFGAGEYDMFFKKDSFK